MFVLPLVAFPLVLALAAYRLWTVPRRMMAGTLHLAHPRLSPLSVLTALAYLGLLGYTAALLVVLARTLALAPTALSAWLAAAPAFGGYPVAWVVVEWVFYHGFRRPPRPPRPARPAPPAGEAR